MRVSMLASVLLAALVLLAPLAEGCASTCSSNSDCSGGEVCLFAPGGGCSAKGSCGTAATCVAAGAPVVLCSCTSGTSIALTCVADNLVDEMTTNGECPGQGPKDAGTQ